MFDRPPNNVIEITKVVEFDTAHRIPNHKSKCRHLHGHRYRLEATYKGKVSEARGDSREGMVLDFSELKEMMMSEIHDKFDHSLVLFEGDPLIPSGILSILPAGHQHRLLKFIPTAENLADYFHELLHARLLAHRQYLQERGDRSYDYVDVVKVVLYETPNSWATSEKIPDFEVQ